MTEEMNHQLLVRIRATGQGHTTTFNNNIARASSVNEAIFLSWFLWMWEHKSRKGEMFLTIDSFCNRSSISKNSMRNITKKWEDLGIISTRLRGSPPKRFYRLKPTKFTQYIDGLLCYSQPSRSSMDEPSRSSMVNHREVRGLNHREVEGFYIRGGNIEKQDKVEKKNIVGLKKTARLRAEDSSFSDKTTSSSKTSSRRNSLLSSKKIKITTLKGKRLDFSERMVDILHKQLTKQKKIMRRPELDKWIASFRLFMQNSGLPKKELKSTLMWYVGHINDPYVPQAYSMNTFCNKFVRIQEARKRQADIPEEEFIPPINAKEKLLNNADGWEIGIEYYHPETGKFLGKRLYDA